MANKWYQKAINEKPPYDLGGWKKTQAPATRRSHALESRPGNWSLDKRRLSASRALQALANVTEDKATARKAEADARYFRRIRR